MSRPRKMPEMVALDTDRTACHPSRFEGKYQTELFFSESVIKRRQAIAICESCELRQECLAGARERHEEWGIWGGHEFRRGRDFIQARIRHITPPPRRR